MSDGRAPSERPGGAVPEAALPAIAPSMLAAEAALHAAATAHASEDLALASQVLRELFGVLVRQDAAALAELRRWLHRRLRAARVVGAVDGRVASRRTETIWADQLAALVAGRLNEARDRGEGIERAPWRVGTLLAFDIQRHLPALPGARSLACLRPAVDDAVRGVLERAAPGAAPTDVARAIVRAALRAAGMPKARADAAFKHHDVRDHRRDKPRNKPRNKPRS